MTEPHALLGSNYRYDTESGYFVSTKHQRLAEVIKDYNPELSLLWVPNANRSENDPDKPFVIVHTRIDGTQYPVFFLDETDMDEPDKILTRLFLGDMAKHGPVSMLDAIETRDRVEQILKAKEWEEKRAEAKEIMNTMFSSPLHTFHHNGKKFYPKGR